MGDTIGRFLAGYKIVIKKKWFLLLTFLRYGQE